MEMFCRYELDPDDDLNMDFDDLLKKAMGLLGAKEKLASLVQVEKESQGVEDLVEKCDYKTRISSTPNRLVTSPSIPTYQPPIFSAPNAVQTRGAELLTCGQEDRSSYRNDEGFSSFSSDFTKQYRHLRSREYSVSTSTCFITQPSSVK